MTGLRAAFVALVLILVAANPVSAQEPGAPQAETVVAAAYDGLLGRTSEPEGLAYWTDLIESGARAGDVVAAIGDAVEYRRLVVSTLYGAILQRTPDDGGLTFWSEGLSDRFSAGSLAVELYASEEFFLRSGGTDGQFIDGLYGSLFGRVAEEAGRSYWVGLIDDGTSRAAVAREILRSTEGVLQPDLSVVSSVPADGGVGSADQIRIELDRPVIDAASAVIVSVGGVRVPGLVTADPNDPAVLNVQAIAPGSTKGIAVVTIFATFENADGSLTVESVDFSFQVGARSEPFEDPEGELIIAFYGHPRTAVLGVAGEGTPQQALDRLMAQAQPYVVTGRPIVPAFEMISTLVTATPGTDGLYRRRETDETLRPYLDAVRTVGGRLILDIQPGKADVLDEAMAYESLLLEPEVGLALDPEWVVGPNQTPKGRIGRLDAADINRVAAYLSDLVKANNLPPKILIIHRFNPGMVTNTDRIESPNGVRILFHADGEGGPAAKIADYDDLLPTRFEKGIKVFYDEDSPTMTPAQVLERTNPDPTFISYQ